MAKVDRSGQDGGLYSLVLHGPPGSSKTAISEALSEQMWHHAQRWGTREARLIRITPADFTQRGEGRLDSEARMIFNLLRHVRGVTILFDEIDDLLLRRESGGGRRFMDLIVPAMLNRLQDLRSACPSQEICFVLGTNFVENIEPALLRKGRIDRMYPVVYPDWNTRLATIGKHLDPIIADQLKRGSPADQDEFRRWATRTVRWLGRRTAGWPWLVINGLCGDVARTVKDRDLKPDARKVLKGEFAKMYARERNALVEPAYVGRLLRHFDSPELRNEYLLHLLSRANREETGGQLLSRANADAKEYIKAHFSQRERSRQVEIWRRQIIPKLRRSAITLLKRRSYFFDPDQTR
jgi:SpoVK/Ycf46/Vps4 family AAA+-type ATPase